MPDKDEERVVLERGLDHAWRTPDYIQPLPRKLWYRRLPRPRLPDFGGSQTARTLRLAVIISLVLFGVLFVLFGSLRGFQAEGMSMEPGLHDGDHVIVNRLAYPHIDFG